MFSRTHRARKSVSAMEFEFVLILASTFLKQLNAKRGPWAQVQWIPIP